MRLSRIRGALASALMTVATLSGVGIAVPAQAQTPVVEVGSATVDESDLSEAEALILLQKALREQGYEGDVTEEALRRESETAGIDSAKVNGCSTPKVTKRLTKKWDRVFRPACNKHDVCYSKNSRTPRKTCDWRFREDMYKICKGRSQDGNECRRAASTYYYAVRAFGKKYYKGKGSSA